MSSFPPPPPPPAAWAGSGGFPPPPPPPPPARAPAPARSGPVKALAAGIALLLVAAAAVLVAHTTGDGARFAHPDAWDPRVADLVDFVEDARALTFDHPVYVDFLSAEEYRAEAIADEAELTDEDREALTRDASMLRALGVASGEVDLFEALNTVVDSGTLAYYDVDDGRIRVRGTEITPGVKATLVHELTHALQDQAFDLRRVFDDGLDPSQRSGLRALVEGDAMRIERRFVDERYDDEELAAFEAEQAGEVEASEAATSEVPGFLSASFATPYLLGAPFVLMLEARGGNAAVDAALRDPPASEEHLFDPASYLAEEEARELDLELEDDIEPADDGIFGPAYWLLVLAERIDPLVAFEAALGWAGDAYAVFEQDGTTCVRAAFAGDDRSDEAEMASALEEWVSTLSDGAARTIDIDGHPGFEACDPGPGVEIELTGRSADVLVLPSLWGQLIAVASGSAAGDAEGTRCFASAIFDDLSWEEIIDPDGAAFVDDSFQQRMFDAIWACS